MKHLLAVFSLAALFVSSGCGSSDPSPCAQVGSLWASCDEPASMAEARCEAYACTGEKQSAIDCVLDLTCSEIDTGYDACLSQYGCELAGTCANLVAYVNGCIDVLGGSSSDYISLSECEAVTCASDAAKQEAINCVLELTCSSSVEYDAYYCVSEAGCTM